MIIWIGNEVIKRGADFFDHFSLQPISFRIIVKMMNFIIYEGGNINRSNFISSNSVF